MPQRPASRLMVFLTLLSAVLATCLLPMSASGRAAMARAGHNVKHSRLPALPFSSVRALQARIVAMKEAAKQQKLDDEAAGTDFLDSILYFMRQRAYPNDNIDASAYARGVAQRDRLAPAVIGHKRMVAETFVPSNTWQFVGPTNLGVPYNPYYGNGPLSGRVNALAYDPVTANTDYLAAAGGGFWKTTNGGSTWTCLSNGWKYQQASCIALDPTNHNTIYVGTGDIAYATYASGIEKSTDGGMTWTDLGLSAFGADGVNAVVVDPETPSIITAAGGNTSYGYVYRSTDGGSTWTHAFSQPGIWTDLKIGAKNTNGVRHCYAASAYTGSAPDEELWRSDDRGMTWTQVTIPATGSDYTEGLVVAPSATAPDTVYLESGNDMMLWKSTDAGATWTDITSRLAAAEPGLSGDSNYNWSQGYYDIALTAVAGSGGADTLYDSLIDLARSTDGGTTWASLGGPTYNQQGNALLHNDQHALAVNPSDPTDSLVGCDGGVYHYVFPTGAASPTITSLNRNVGLTQFYKAAYHPTNPNILIGGAQDNGSPLCQGALTTWGNSPSGGDGGGCAINQTNPGDQYSTSQFLTVSHTTNGWNASSDISPSIPSGENPPFVGVLALDPTHPNLLYTGTQYLYQYNSATGNWTYDLGHQALSGSSSGYVQAIAVAPSNGNIIYTGSVDGQVWVTTNQGARFTEIDGGGSSASPLPSRAVTSIDVNASNPNDILVGLSGTGGGHLYRCSDTTQGTDSMWTNLSGSGSSALPDVPLNAVTRDPDSPTSTYYVGTDIGVFATTDGGMTWTNATAPLGLPNVQVNDLKAVPGTHYLNAATYGRGIWRISLNATPPMITGFSPPAGLAGTSVSLSGSAFTGATSVKFNGVTASYSVVSDSQITATVPSGAATGPITVTTPLGTATSAADYLVTGSPVISGFAPAGGIAGASITITGANFTGATSVTVNGVAATGVTVVSDTSIAATVPVGATTGPIAVTTPAGTSTSATSFMVTVPPAITGFNPASGVVGTNVTITGSSFTGAASVAFNGTPASGFTISGDTTMTATVPAGATTGKMTISNAAGIGTSADNFTVYQTPMISSFNPASGSVGASVTITGSGFTGTTAVTFGGVSAGFTVVSDTSISATVPGGSTTGPVSVTTPGGTATSSLAFTVVSPPIITGFTPASAVAGTNLTISGRNFTGATVVAFNGVTAAYSVVSDTSITATVPSGSSSGPISVTTPGGTATSATNFTLTVPIAAPTITGISPASGTAGTVVTITGTNLSGATTVTINGVSVAFTVVNATTVTVTIPAGTTSGAISVTTPGGRVTSGSISFTFLTWSARDAAAAPDGTARVLWNRSDHAAIVWTLNAADIYTGNTATFGPYTDAHGIWTAKSIRMASDGTTRLLWTRSDGAAGVWTLNAVGVPVAVGPTYGPFSDSSGQWSVSGMGVAHDGSVRLLWVRSDGAAGVWTLNTSDAATLVGPVYGPYSDASGSWRATGIGVAGDNTSRLLWNRSDRAMGVWSLGTSDSQTAVGKTYGPFADSSGTWSASGISASSDGTARVLWNRSDGAAGLWSFSPGDAATTLGPTYGPYPGYGAIALDTMTGASRVLWVRADRACGIWTFNAADTVTVIGSVYGPL